MISKNLQNLFQFYWLKFQKQFFHFRRDFYSNFQAHNLMTVRESTLIRQILSLLTTIFALLLFTQYLLSIFWISDQLISLYSHDWQDGQRRFLTAEEDKNLIFLVERLRVAFDKVFFCKKFVTYNYEQDVVERTLKTIIKNNSFFVSLDIVFKNYLFVSKEKIKNNSCFLEKCSFKV